MPFSSRAPRGTKTPADAFDPRSLHFILQARYGPSGWWPGESPLEVIVGAVLTQNTAWSNVEKAISSLKKAGMLDLGRLHEAGEAELAALIRPSGYYNIKARRLKNLVQKIMDAARGDLPGLLALDAPC